MSSPHANECSICERSFDADDDLVITACLHLFHRGCAQKRVDESKKTDCRVCHKVSALDEALCGDPATTNKDCSICEEIWYPQEDLVMTSCHHVFHRICAQKRLDTNKKTNCHICKKDSALNDALKQKTNHSIAQQMTFTKINRFVNNDVSELQSVNRTSICGYKDLPIVSLKEAVKSIFEFYPGIIRDVEKAEERCRKNVELPTNESAAIYLYTMNTPLNEMLNKALRAENPQAMTPWFLFLRLFINALHKLPSCLSKTVWRGVRGNIGLDFCEKSEHTWCGITSCTSQINVAECFAGEKGSLFCIDTIYGKDITAYAVRQDEKEIILMPGTRLYVQSTSLNADGFFLVHLNERHVSPVGQHVMLSYNLKDQDIVAKMRDILQKEYIPVWFDGCGDCKEDMYDSLANGVENAAVVCCFLTSDYETSEVCKLELQYAHKRGKPIIPCMISDTKSYKTSTWLKPILENLECIDIDDIFDLEGQLQAKTFINYINQRLSLSKYPRLRSVVARPSYLFELVKYKYLRTSTIERFMNPSKSFSIAQSYINLTIIENKEHQDKEKKLRGPQNSDAIIDTFEQIDATKTTIEVKDIFTKCTNQARQVLVFGRAGIGKSTVCRYVAFQWATGALWQEYELVLLISLRSLTEHRYPVGTNYSLVDIVEKECLFYLSLSEKDKQLLQQELRKSRILWVLDGYDEIVQNTSSHLLSLLEQLLQTQHHILTSRPYMNTLPYSVQMEIMGFTDENITDYVKLFFDELESVSPSSSAPDHELLSFLKLNPRIWGIAHVPINLELICSLWSNIDLSKTNTMTLTILYANLIEWICRRYLEKQRRMSINLINLLDRIEVDQHCQNELTFLETLAFRAMESNTILLDRDLLRKAKNETKCSFIDHPHLLNLGILKSFTQYGTGSRIEADKDHYFVHLSFQEFFAARYLAKALSDSKRHKAIHFIQDQKYNHRFQLVFIFLSGLIMQSGEEENINTFWNTILNEPLDLVGIRHMHLVISCFDAIECNQTLIHSNSLMNLITEWIEHALAKQPAYLCDSLTKTLQSCTTISNNQEVQNTLMKLLTNEQTTNLYEVLSFISSIPLTNPTPSLVRTLLIHTDYFDSSVRLTAWGALINMGENAVNSEVINRLVTALGHQDEKVRSIVCHALGAMGENAASSEVINRLAAALGDEDPDVRSGACKALCKMGEKAATNEVVNGLVAALSDKVWNVRCSACDALCKMGEKAATTEVMNGFSTILCSEYYKIRDEAWEVFFEIGVKAGSSEVINRLVAALGDEDPDVRSGACDALGKMGKKAACSEVTDRLVAALSDKVWDVRCSACDALCEMGEKAATNEVVNGLVTALGDKDCKVRSSACKALCKMGEKAATNEVVNGLVAALSDKVWNVRCSARDALCKMGEKTVSSELINRLVAAFGDEDPDVRSGACDVLCGMGEKAATSEVIDRLLAALDDKGENVRSSACKALCKMGEKAATNEVVNGLVAALDDKGERVRSSACDALGKMGEKAARGDVINRLVATLDAKDCKVRSSAWHALSKICEKVPPSEVVNRFVAVLGDKDWQARRSACDALCKIGEKAATNEVVNGLVIALGDEDPWNRRRVCEALGKMGEKTVSSELINRLVTALGDGDPHVRYSACNALGNMGEKAASSEVIDALATALGDKELGVRRLAYFALGKIGEKAATNEVVNGLAIALAEEDPWDRERVCEALGKIGGKAATSEVISAIANALDDENSDVRSSACDALYKMGEKAASSEVIDALVTALGDKEWGVSRRAYDALCKMGEKAASNAVVNGLVIALDHEDSHLRSRACDVLGAMGEKAASNAVVNGLVIALDHEDSHLRSRACDALGAMGENAASSEVINRLVAALGDEDEAVISSACYALVGMGEKGATTEVIDRLVMMLGHEDEGVGTRAYEALGAMGQKAATTEMINRLVNALKHDWFAIRNECWWDARLACLSALAVFYDKEVESADAVETFERCFRVGSISHQRLLKAYLDTRERTWLHAVICAFVVHRAAVTVFENRIRIYEQGGVTDIPVSDSELVVELRKGFAEVMGHVDFNVPIGGNW